MKDRSTLLLFTVLVFVVFLTQVDLLKYTLEIGFVPDDWSYTLFYRTHVHNPILDYPEVWKERGAYTTHAVYYIGVLHSLVGLNFQAFQAIGIALKILATLTIFPLVMIIFGTRLLAFLTSFLFAISYTTTGQLEVVVEQGEYLGLLLMNMFLIVYVHTIKKKLLDWKHLGLATFMLVTTLMLSTIRTFPILVLLPLIEASLWLKNRTVKNFKKSFIRLAVLFFPFFILFLSNKSSQALGMAVSFPPTPILKIIQGNWHLGLVPIQGLGHMLSLTPILGKLLGSINMESFTGYINFLLRGPLIFFGAVTLVLALARSKQKIKFFFLTLSLNFFFQILVYFAAIHRLSISKDLRLNFDNPVIYLTIMGTYVLTLVSVFFLEWKNQKNDKEINLAIWAAPLASLVFITMTWLYAGSNWGWSGAQDHYLMIPTVGISLFLGGLLTLLYNKKGLFALIVFAFIIQFYFINRETIYKYFIGANMGGRSAIGQQFIQSKFKQKISKIDLSKSNFFYFDTSEIENNGRFFTESFLSSFSSWMHFQGNNLIDGCLEMVYFDDHKMLLNYIQEQDGERKFLHKGFCVENGKSGYRNIYYDPENFYAFKLKDRDFIDIREEVLKELGF